MQSIAEFLVRALAARSVRAHMYLDDVIVISATAELAHRDYSTTLQLLSSLGPKKLHPPLPAITWLGIEIDVASNQLTIPPEKLAQIKLCMAVAAKRMFITKKHLQGLNHLSMAVRAARTFICCLLDIADIAWYAHYASTHNGHSIIPNECVVMRIWADAGLLPLKQQASQRLHTASMERRRMICLQ